MRNFNNKAKDAAGALKSVAYQIYGSLSNKFEEINLSNLALLRKALDLFPDVESACNFWGKVNLWLLIRPMGILI